MTNDEKILNKYKLNPKKIKYLKKVKIIDTDKGTYTLKIKTSNNNKIYTYLENRNFENYLPPINSPKDPYEIYEYIEESEMSKEDKALNLIYILSILHTKTTVYENTNLDSIKEIYESNLKELEYLDYYYHDLQDYIENKVYMSPEEYLLIRNITNIYNAISFSREALEKWYNEKLKQTRERQVLLHNNISTEHFLLSKDNAYLINWNKAKRGYPIYDLITFFKNEYQDLEFKSLYNLYQKKYKYTYDEELLFFSLIAKPWKITFTNNHYNNTIIVTNLIEYIEKGSKLVSKENKENQETE